MRPPAVMMAVRGPKQHQQSPMATQKHPAQGPGSQRNWVVDECSQRLFKIFQKLHRAKTDNEVHRNTYGLYTGE
ncbi:hypothetical protein U0070_008174 [Myodes glareolus]|uniref:Uncharacterized protein n=1 Tax=Myodes glareolus TaxID=447135 RepID=A0AAW0HPI0_MYOGA